MGVASADESLVLAFAKVGATSAYAAAALSQFWSLAPQSLWLGGRPVYPLPAPTIAPTAGSSPSAVGDNDDEGDGEPKFLYLYFEENDACVSTTRQYTRANLCANTEVLDIAPIASRSVLQHQR